MRYFCTYFDINYLPRARCLFASLQRTCTSYRIYALCLDNTCFERLQALGPLHVIPVRLSDLEAAAPELETVKRGRTRLEYYYTCGPAFIDYLMSGYPEIDILTYLDADLYFLGDPEILFQEFAGHSIGVMAHHLPEHRRNIWQGIYNVGWISFRRDPDGIGCLKWWRDRCIEWCFERYEDGKYADQLYLDQWPRLFDGFHEFGNHGANVGAWNVRDYRFSLQDQRVFVDEDQLVFYHFHGFKKVSPHIYNTNLGLTFRPPNVILKQHVFLPYVEELERYSVDGRPTASIRKYRARYHVAKTLVRLSLGVVFRQYIYVKNGKII